MHIDLSESEVAVIRDALDDACCYRLGEASNLADPDLDPHDRIALVRYHELMSAHPELEVGA